MRALLLAAIALVVLSMSAMAPAQEASVRSYAIIVGNNLSRFNVFPLFHRTAKFHKHGWHVQ